MFLFFSKQVLSFVLSRKIEVNLFSGNSRFIWLLIDTIFLVLGHLDKEEQASYHVTYVGYFDDLQF